MRSMLRGYSANDDPALVEESEEFMGMVQSSATRSKTCSCPKPRRVVRSTRFASAEEESSNRQRISKKTGDLGSGEDRISPIPCGSGMENGKTWPRPSYRICWRSWKGFDGMVE